MKENGKGRPPKRKVTDDSKMVKAAVASEKPHNNLENGKVTCKRPKRAAACSNFKEETVRISEKSILVETKKVQIEEDEEVAIDLTRLGAEDLPPCRRLVDFTFHDADGNAQPFEMSEIDDCFITALILPMDDNMEKDRERGIKCEGFGRIESWSISGYDEGSPIIWVSTENADYECVKPASSYKKFYDLFYEKARTCIEVYRKLARSVGGNPNLSLEELLAAVIRSMSGTKNFPGGLSSRDFVISLGDFVYNQLTGLDETSANNDVHLATLPALLALRDECRSRSESCKQAPRMSNGNLKINEGKNLDATEDDDEKLATILQEEEDWKAMKQKRGRHSMNSQKNIYVKISEAEIANDYPLPAYYRPSTNEMDEYIFFESESHMSYSDLPRRILDNWALYNSDSRLITLELLPMKPCAEVDVTIFGSGQMREDDGCGYFLDEDLGRSSSSATNHSYNEGVPTYLSAIKEWMIEFGSSMIFISIRTDVAWLGKPTQQYVPWYEPVLKTARLAIAIITLLKEQTRVSKLSFVDVIKKVSAFDKSHPAYISSNLALVERFIVVHGQIILQQFAEYPDEKIRKCAFVSGLSDKMEQKCHTKLIMKKRSVVRKEANLNPCAAMGPVISNRKVMRATTTRFISKIWGDYYLNYFPEDSRGGDPCESLVPEEEQEDNDDEDVDEEMMLVQVEKAPTPHSSSRSCHSNSSDKEIRWEGKSIGQMDSGESLYHNAVVRGQIIAVGGAVTTEVDEADVPAILFVEYMFEKHDGIKMVHGRMMHRGSQTILGNAADEREVFLADDCMEIELGNVKESIVVDIRLRSWGHKYRKEYANADKIDRAKAEENKRKGLPMEYYCKSLYCPEKGGFFALPCGSLGLGSGFCSSCKERTLQVDEFILSSETSFVHKKIEYSVQDFMYVQPQCFAEEKEEDHGTFKAGRNVGLKAYVVCQILEIQAPIVSKKPTTESTKVKVRRFYRPEDVSSSKAYSSDIREVSLSMIILFFLIKLCNKWTDDMDSMI
ncbi:hypothetical protein B296_00026989 [Ensete ventricosum]|uniref:BAH domain-containing protein n=1 Tax=Ensete ventricosum TaxID=4639 RepID=A0A426YBP6_ENSVE|nr:hypothetical protein B296_00026989 [Ensete ventricosum]